MAIETPERTAIIGLLAALIDSMGQKVSEEEIARVLRFPDADALAPVLEEMERLRSISSAPANELENAMVKRWLEIGQRIQRERAL